MNSRVGKIPIIELKEYFPLGNPATNKLNPEKLGFTCKNLAFLCMPQNLRVTISRHTFEKKILNFYRRVFT